MEIFLLLMQVLNQTMYMVFFLSVFFYFYFLSSFLYSCSFLSQWVPCTYETYVGLIYHNFLPFSFCIVTINCQNLNRIQIWYYTILCSIFMLNVWPLSIPKFNIYIWKRWQEKTLMDNWRDGRIWSIWVLILKMMFDEDFWLIFIYFH